jgi:DNA-binding IclR family transcriptional regulator
LIGEYAVPGVTAMGLPVFSRTRTPVPVRTVAALASRMRSARQREILPLLKAEAQHIADLLGQ